MCMCVRARACVRVCNYTYNLKGDLEINIHVI